MVPAANQGWLKFFATTRYVPLVEQETRRRTPQGRNVQTVPTYREPRMVICTNVPHIKRDSKRVCMRPIGKRTADHIATEATWRKDSHIHTPDMTAVVCFHPKGIGYELNGRRRPGHDTHQRRKHRVMPLYHNPHILAHEPTTQAPTCHEVNTGTVCKHGGVGVFSFLPDPDIYIIGPSRGAPEFLRLVSIQNSIERIGEAPLCHGEH